MTIRKQSQEQEFLSSSPAEAGAGGGTRWQQHTGDGSLPGQHLLPPSCSAGTGARPGRGAATTEPIRSPSQAARGRCREGQTPRSFP